MIRRLGVAAVTVLVALALAGTAAAYSFPSGATSSSSCPSFPTDPSQLAADSLVTGPSSIAANAWTTGPASASLAAGEYELGFQYVSVSWIVQSEDSGGSWEDVAEGSQSGEIFYLPAGPARVLFYTSVAQSYPVGLIAVSPAAASPDAQGLAALCDQVASDEAQNTTNGATLGAIETTLGEIQSDLTGTIDVSTEGPTGDQTVILSPADRQMVADLGGQLDGDIWLAMGLAIGLFVAAVVVWKVWL